MDNLLLDYKQMSELFSVREATVRYWVFKDKIPKEVIFKMPGKKGCTRFIKSKVERWINGDDSLSA